MRTDRRQWYCLTVGGAGVVLLVVGMTALFPGAARAVAFDDLRHLLARTGFGLPDRRDIARFADLTYPQTVDILLDEAQSTPAPDEPDWGGYSDPAPIEWKSWDPERRKTFRVRQRQAGWLLKRWWVRQMLNTPTPLRERMTLFWHNHFVSALMKVKSPPLMLAQNQLLRRHALGNFADMLRAIAVDPAMLMYLDGRMNRKQNPNENFAREVMELFTLGDEKIYSEQDIKEAARAFTGWMIEPQTGAFVFRSNRHDAGEKNFLGQRGTFNGDDILAILLKQPGTATFITTRLWREFVGTAPEPTTINRLADQFRRSGYELRPLVQAILLSDQFHAATTPGNIVKSPVDMVVGTVRFFGPDRLDTGKVAKVLKNLGQDLFDPPNVKGWPGGTTWVTTASLAQRLQILERSVRGLMGGSDMSMSRQFPIDDLTRLLLARPALTDLSGGHPVDRIRKLLLDPVFQVK